MLTATAVITDDIVLTHDEATQAQNAETLGNLRAENAKLSGSLQVLGGGPSFIDVQFARSGITHLLKIATTGKQPFDTDKTTLLETDHVQRTSNGGNAYNEATHLQQLEGAGMLRSGPMDIIAHSKKRTMLHIATGKHISVLGEEYPRDLSEFGRHRQTIENGALNITDVNLASVLGEGMGNGHCSLLNPTSSMRGENGFISANAGAAPGLSLSLKEMREFLEGTFCKKGLYYYPNQFVIHPSPLQEERDMPYFTHGVLNPAVQEMVDTYGWQYSQLMYDFTGRKPSVPCDLVLTAGPAGGAARMHGIWTFTNTPQVGNSRLDSEVQYAQRTVKNPPKEHLTDFSAIQDTVGCGDSVAAMQAFANAESPYIRDRLRELLQLKLVTNERYLDIAECIHASILMRLYALLVFHTMGTSLRHLPAYFLQQKIHDAALVDAAEITASISPASLHPRKPVIARAQKHGINIAIWKQNEDREWPRSPLLQLHGVNQDPDEMEPWETA